jgi:hypothetical protein
VTWSNRTEFAAVDAGMLPANGPKDKVVRTKD